MFVHYNKQLRFVAPFMSLSLPTLFSPNCYTKCCETLTDFAIFKKKKNKGSWNVLFLH